MAIRRNAAMLPAYSFLLGLIALLGFMGLAAGVQPRAPSGAQWLVLASYRMFCVVALSSSLRKDRHRGTGTASIMSIAASESVHAQRWRRWWRPDISDRDESQMAKLTSLKTCRALLFIVFLPTQYAINLQLLGGVWIIQILPTVVVGLYTRWLHRWGLLPVGRGHACPARRWRYRATFVSVYPPRCGRCDDPGYAARYALVPTGVAIVATWVLRATARESGRRPDCSTRLHAAGS